MNAINATANAVTFLLDNDGLWESRIWFGNVPPQTAYPYVWIVFQGGAEQNADLKADPLITLAVTASALDQQTALDCGERIGALLNDTGAHDRFPRAAGIGGWAIRTITRAAFVYMEEPIDNAERVYRCGNQYLFNMEGQH